MTLCLTRCQTMTKLNWRFRKHWNLGLRFALRPVVFEIKVVENRKAKVSCVHGILTPRGPRFTPFRSTTSHFRDIRLLKIGNAPNVPRMTLRTCQKYRVYTKYSPEGPNFTLFRCMVACFPDNWGFGFPIGCNCEIKKIVKNRKLKISKIRNNTFVRRLARFKSYLREK